MNDLPSLRNLIYLSHLHEEQNFRRAAKVCGVSQSTLSTGIKTLEELLGDQLLERFRKTFAFTVVGEEVVLRARKLLAEANDLVELVKNQRSIMAGEVRLGCVPTIAPFLLRPIFEHCEQHYPDLILTVTEDTDEQLTGALTRGELDLLLVAQPVPVEVGKHHYMKLGIDPFKFVVHSTLVEAMGEPLDIQRLPGNSIHLLREESCMTKSVLRAHLLDSHGKVNPITVTSLHTLVQLISGKPGATFLPQMAIDGGILNHTPLHVMPLSGEVPYREIGLMWRKSSIKVATLSKLGGIIKEVHQEAEKTTPPSPWTAVAAK
ncbi:LysR family transcriptional regulator [Shewanella psychropiezotolerans]|uniref:LysR family transcriptional regulator n=2 Tax=Shewanella psychropiezotolerans TaxID=2593655 RepID=A0ABX5X8E3_9GAMM|nr:LysR family transcriptional regulator [Shewanella psychropiezotolerans]